MHAEEASAQADTDTRLSHRKSSFTVQKINNNPLRSVVKTIDSSKCKDVRFEAKAFG